jgi:hypothetical protein
LLIVWGIGFLTDMRTDTTRPDFANSSPQSSQMGEGLTRVASSFVGQSVELGMSMAAKDSQDVAVVSALMKEPAPIIKHTQSLMKSSEMRAFVNDVDTQAQLESNDIDAILNNPLFIDLIKKPEIQPLVKAMAGDDIQGDANDRYLAEKMTFVWQKVQSVKDNPELIELMSDPDVKSTLESGNTFAVMTNPKVQRVLAVIMESGLASQQSSEHSRAQTDDRSQSATTDVYRWRDDHGQIQYSDWDHIPVHKRSEAELSN